MLTRDKNNENYETVMGKLDTLGGAGSSPVPPHIDKSLLNQGCHDHRLMLSGRHSKTVIDQLYYRSLKSSSEYSFPAFFNSIAAFKIPNFFCVKGYLRANKNVKK